MFRGEELVDHFRFATSRTTTSDELAIRIAALRAGKPINDGVSAAHSSMMAILGRMVAYSGQKIEWEAAMKSKLDLSPPKYDWGPLSVAPVAVPGVTKFV